MTERKILTGSQLKMIAMASMLLDHMGAALLLPLLQGQFRTEGIALWVAEHWDILVKAYYYLRYIGRFAFPIYCFLLVEGFFHTKSVPKYALRLAIFCLISEIPFDLAFNGSFLEFGSNNVFFTLLLGLLAIQATTFLRKKLEAGNPHPVLKYLLLGLGSAILLAVACFAAKYIFRCDYDAYGVAAIFLLYLLKPWPVLGFLSAVGLLYLQSSMEVYAFFMVVPIALYNGKRGKPMGIGPYVFYPAHLLLLWGIGAALLFP